MASLELKNIYKVYPSGNVAVTDFNLSIEDKEFIVFVGPSGCGKSTTLRMIAGLEEISAGELYIDDRLVNNVAPKDRDIAMVFQSYALYPHMTVYDNIAFGLKLRKMPKEEIKERVMNAARILGIEQYLTRKPKALSGGQRQRVALGRAIVRDPKVFLLDEPLSNLDAKLRSQMRTEITKLHNRLATTFIYVTHDQVEAMTMGTRIVVMKDGFMQQADTPINLYDHPANQFVAGFIGSPQMNFFDAELIGKDGKVYVKFGSDTVLLPKEKVNAIMNLEQYLNTGKPIVFGIRPEDLHDDPLWVADSTKPKITVNIDVVEALGAETLIYCKTMDVVAAGEGESIYANAANLIARVNSRSTSKAGDTAQIALDIIHCHMFDKETEMTILDTTPVNVRTEVYKPVEAVAPVAVTKVEEKKEEPKPAPKKEEEKKEEPKPAPAPKKVEEKKEEPKPEPKKMAAKKVAVVAAPKKETTTKKLEEKYVPDYSKGKWEIVRQGLGEYVAKLHAGKGNVILTSEIYTTEEGARSGIQTLIKNIGNNNFFISNDKNGEYYFKIKTKTNRLLCVGTIWPDEESVKRDIDVIKHIASKSPIE